MRFGNLRLRFGKQPPEKSPTPATRHAIIVIVHRIVSDCVISQQYSIMSYYNVSYHIMLYYPDPPPPRDIPDKKLKNVCFDEKRYCFCGKGFRKLILKFVIWSIARPRPDSPSAAARYTIMLYYHILYSVLYYYVISYYHIILYYYIMTPRTYHIILYYTIISPSAAARRSSTGHTPAKDKSHTVSFQNFKFVFAA